MDPMLRAYSLVTRGEGPRIGESGMRAGTEYDGVLCWSVGGTLIENRGDGPPREDPGPSFSSGTFSPVDATVMMLSNAELVFFFFTQA